MSESKDSARQSIQELITQFRELNDQAEQIRQQMDKISQQIDLHQATLSKSSHELDVPPYSGKGSKQD